MSTGELNACAFCMDTTDVGLAGDGVTLEVTRAGLRSSQFVWSHRRCRTSGCTNASPAASGSTIRACLPSGALTERDTGDTGRAGLEQYTEAAPDRFAWSGAVSLRWVWDLNPRRHR
ncbi:hypothetical protein, partial [Streptomyces sp. NRRL S-15]|uniref:hypothetical protein n=1 Tax=Streptomyces sp. NRRL S-15 TaxID=1463886 RepID=UPI001F39FFFB